MILVTGGTGHIGQQIVDAMTRAQLPLRLLTRDTLTSHLESGYDVFRADMADPSSLTAAMKGVDSVFLSSGAGAELVTLQNNVTDAAVKAGVKRIIKLSSRGADSSSEVSLLRYHGLAEDHIRLSGAAFTFLRPTFMFENFLQSAKTIATTNTLAAPMGGARVSFLSASDLASVAVKVLTEDGHERQAYYLTGPQALTHQDVAAEMSRVLEIPVQYRNVSPEEYGRHLAKAGASIEFIHITLELYADWRAGNASVPQDTVQRVLGVSPISLRDFLQLHKDHFRMYLPN